MCRSVDGAPLFLTEAALDDRPETRLGQLRGFVDVAGPLIVCGWAQDERHPHMPVALEVLADGHVIRRVIADLYRADLAQTGVYGNRHAFEVALPPEFSGPIEVRRAADRATLPFTEAAIARAALRDRRALALSLRPLLERRIRVERLAKSIGPVSDDPRRDRAAS